jgi:hypothetical protein
MPDGPDPVPTSSGTISIPGGAQGLVIDAARHRAYTQLWHGGVVEIDLMSRAVVEKLDNGCADSRGLALDETRGFLFCACYDGTTTSLDVGFDGHIVSRLDRGVAPDNIGYNPTLGRLYLVGGGYLTMASVSTDGTLSFVAKRETTDSAHSVVADDDARAWVASPEDGTLYRIADPYPSGL